MDCIRSGCRSVGRRRCVIEVLYEDPGSAWTQRHRGWLRAQDIGGDAQITLLDHLGAIDVLESRR
jgi:hypothetical protein